ncbi:MAG: hypothetical protein AAB336_12510 [Acidobacteriota bacterium]|mgnify:CR=1 FL=1
MLNQEELQKLTITDLISLMNYLDKKSEMLQRLIQLSTKDSDVRAVHENCYGACGVIYSAIENELADRAEKIYDGHRIQPKIEFV